MSTKQADEVFEADGRRLSLEDHTKVPELLYLGSWCCRGFSCTFHTSQVIELFVLSAKFAKVPRKQSGCREKVRRKPDIVLGEESIFLALPNFWRKRGLEVLFLWARGGGAQVLLGSGPCHAQAGKLDSIVLEGLSFLENFFQPVFIVSLGVQTHKVCYALTPHVLERVKDFCGDLVFIDEQELEALHARSHVRDGKPRFERKLRVTGGTICVTARNPEKRKHVQNFKALENVSAATRCVPVSAQAASRITSGALPGTGWPAEFRGPL